MVINAMERYTAARVKAWQWTREINWVKKLSLALAVACLIGILAQTRIPLPWTPVPITGQTFAVLLAPLLLGHIWGGVSLLLYVGLGVAFIPWFTGWTGGLAAIAGPTGGYLV
ncbi:MAG TPA: biotin transporter BioY, partial [Dehalococcoidales bacterium]|nr:biotin transporter BioY [Dehalococcoidales bacterium]